MTEYREGGDPIEEKTTETVDNVTELKAEKPAEVPSETPSEAEQAMPVTALLVVLLPDGRVEVSTELSGFKMARKASIRDAITLCKTAASELEMTVLAKTVAKELQIQAQQHALQKQMQQVTREVSRIKR